MKKLLTLSALLLALAFASACGGSGNGHVLPPPEPTADNITPLYVDGGPWSNYANGIFTDVMICQPGSSNCTTLHNMLVDTGSYGIRVFSSSIPTLTLPAQNATDGNPLATCAVFVDSVMWGPVRRADVLIGAEEADNIPIHVVGNSEFPVSTDCSSYSINILSSSGPEFPPDGVLGIGNFREDCGAACALPIEDSRNPGLYFECPPSGCTPSTATLAQQIQNPVFHFANDNNGVILSLPSVPNHDAPSVQGSLIFGIGTQSNNGLGNAVVFPLDSSANLSTGYSGTTHVAYLDSASNGLFFGSSTSSMPECTNATGFYCPALAKNLSATIQGATAGSPTKQVDFTILNTERLFDSQNFVFDNLGGPNPPENTWGIPVFDWGLPFFFGRDVYFSIEGQSTPAGSDLFVAF